MEKPEYKVFDVVEIPYIRFNLFKFKLIINKLIKIDEIMRIDGFIYYQDYKGKLYSQHLIIGVFNGK